jgi:hypothetical protein
MTWFSLSILQTLLQTDIFLVLSTTAYSSDVKYKNPLTFLISLIIHNMGEHIITCSYRCMAGYQRIFFFIFMCSIEPTPVKYYSTNCMANSSRHINHATCVSLSYWISKLLVIMNYYVFILELAMQFVL